VAIARALVNRPALLLADEPTGALDTATGQEIGELLLDLNSSGQTLILVTHNPDLAVRYARRVIRLVDGAIASDAVTGAISEPEGRDAAWTEERGTSDEGRRRLEAPRRRAGAER
jgi:putative ABC transport system ATP-binding protein